MDYDQESIDDLKKYGIDDIYFGDILKELGEPFTNYKYDIIIFGDVIEHVENPGLALRNLKKLCGKNTEIILTTPNVRSIFRISNNFRKKEKVHPDHMFWPSKYTLDNLLSRTGYEIKEFKYMFYGSKNDKNRWKSKILFKLINIKNSVLGTCLLYIIKPKK